jgi:septal ring factor EnvC (AmiA/AmiB activator)
MNEDKTLFAEMLGMDRPQPEADSAPESAAPEADDGETPDELAVQRTVVEDFAREKAELEDEKRSIEEAKAALEAEKAELEAEKAALEAENRALKDENGALKEKVAEFEARPAERDADMEALKELNATLEVKVTRMGRALIAARRRAAEAEKIEIGGRRW